MQTLRSELIRIWRPAFHAGIGLMALSAALVSIFIFTSAEDVTAAPPSSEQGSPSFTVVELASPGGFLSALEAMSTLAGVILLAFWVIAAATDYGTGLIRILVQAHPNRVTLSGKQDRRPQRLHTARHHGDNLGRGLLREASRATRGHRDRSVEDRLCLADPGGLLQLHDRGAGLGADRSRARRGHPQLGHGDRHRDRLSAGRGRPHHNRRSRRRPYLPGGTLSTLVAGGNDQLAWGAALGLVVLYGAVAATVSLAVFRTRDIVS